MLERGRTLSTGGHRRVHPSSSPGRPPRLESAMLPIATDVTEYLMWMKVHNYAHTTIAARERYLDYFISFASRRGITEASEVTFELLLEYQHHLFAHRKRNGMPLSFGTQAQRLVPVAQFFSWLRRSGHITTNPAGDLLMPRPDRRLPEATLSIAEMSAVLAAIDVSRPLGLRDRAVVEVFYSTALRRAELIELSMRDVDYERGTVFVRRGKGAKDRYVPIGERALFWLRLYVELVRPGFAGDRCPEHLFLSSEGTPLCPDWLSRKVRGYLALAGVDKRGSCHLLDR